MIDAGCYVSVDDVFVVALHYLLFIALCGIYLFIYLFIKYLATCG